MNDNEGAASFRLPRQRGAANNEARGGGEKVKDDDDDIDMMCVCPDEDSSEEPDTGLAGDIYVEGLIGRENSDGVLVEFQTGRLAEATWD